MPHRIAHRVHPACMCLANQIHPPCTQVTHTAREEVKRLLELARSSHLGGSTGFEGVYSSGDGFGADLRKGSKRLRQTCFRSPFEAALERARWAKLADPGAGPDPGTSTRLSSAQSQTQSLPW